MASALERARHTMARIRARTKQQEPIRALGAFGGGAAVGALERSGILPPAILGFPSKPIVAGLAYAVSGALSGSWAAAVRGAGAGVFGAYGYAAGKSGTLIAGDETAIGDAEDVALFSQAA